VSKKFIHQGASARGVSCQVLDACIEVPDNAAIAENLENPVTEINRRGIGRNLARFGGYSTPLMIPIIRPEDGRRLDRARQVRGEAKGDGRRRPREQSVERSYTPYQAVKNFSPCCSPGNASLSLAST